MLAYTIRRLIMLVPTLILTTMAVFFMVRFIPGNVIDIMLAQNAGDISTEDMDAARKELEHRLGFDKPLWEQYGTWIWGIMHGDLGTSLWGR
jgi:peptide/nickel transport system permease protein